MASVVGRAEVLSSIFFLLSFLCYTKAILKSPSLLTTVKQQISWPYLFLSVTLAVLSLLSKEQGITVLGVSIIFDMLLHWTILLNTVTGGKGLRKGGEGKELGLSEGMALVNGSNTSNGHSRGAATHSLTQESLKAMLGRVGELKVYHTTTLTE